MLMEQKMGAVGTAGQRGYHESRGESPRGPGHSIGPCPQAHACTQTMRAQSTDTGTNERTKSPLETIPQQAKGRGWGGVGRGDATGAAFQQHQQHWSKTHQREILMLQLCR